MAVQVRIPSKHATPTTPLMALRCQASYSLLRFFGAIMDVEEQMNRSGPATLEAKTVWSSRPRQLALVLRGLILCQNK